MATIDCARCGASFPEASLVYTDAGQICMDCEEALEEAKAFDSKVQALMLSGPALSVAGVGGLVGGFIPLLGLLFLVLVPFLGLMGLVQGLRALRMATTHEGLSSNQKTGLLVSGAISTLWCLGLIVAGTGMLALSLLAVAAVSL